MLRFSPRRQPAAESVADGDFLPLHVFKFPGGNQYLICSASEEVHGVPPNYWAFKTRFFQHVGKEGPLCQSLKHRGLPGSKGEEPH